MFKISITKLGRASWRRASQLLRRPAILTVLLAAVLLHPASASADGLSSGLIGYWQFNGNGNDSSGKGNTVTLNGSAGFGPGLFGQGLSLNGFQGTNASMTTNNTAFDFGSGNFTIQVWVNFNSVSGEQTLLEKFSGCCGPGWTLTTPGGSDLQFYASGGPILNFGLAIPTGVWQQFVAERNGNTWELFWDGNLVASAINSGSIIPSTNPLLFGARNSADDRNFTLNGTEDEVAIWDRGLSAQEINALWNGGAGMQVPEPGTFVLLSLGLLGLAGICLRRMVR